MADQGISELGIRPKQIGEFPAERPPIPVMESLLAIPPYIRAQYAGLQVTPYFPFLMENDVSENSISSSKKEIDSV